MKSLLSVFAIYCSLLPCAVFFLTMYKGRIKAEKLLGIHVLFSLFFFCIFQLSKAVLPPSCGFFLTAVITVLLLSAVYHKLFEIDSLLFFLHLSMVMSVLFLIYSLIHCSGIFKSTALLFSSAQEGTAFFSGIASLVVSGLFTAAILFLYLSWLRHFVSNRSSLRLRQLPLVPLTVSLLEVNCFLYLINPAGYSSYFQFGFVVITLLCTAAFCYIILNENRIRNTLLPFDVNALLKRQLPYLNRQIQLLETAETAVHQYKKQADLSCSVDDAFAKNRTYLMSLYTDDPAFNSLFAYYADAFEKKGIRYSFTVSISTRLPLSDSLPLFLLYELLETTEEAAFLSFTNHLNIYTLRFETEMKRKNELILLIQQFRFLAEHMEILETITDSESLCKAEIHMIVL